MLISVVFNGTQLLGVMIFLGLFIVPVVGYILGLKLGDLIFKIKKVKFNKTKLYKKLKKAGCLDEFVNTIYKEIDDENTIKYYSDIYGCGLLMTETWFVFIDSKYPKFLKTKEIAKISDEVSISSKRTKNYMRVELENNTYIRINHLSCDDIEKEVKTKYPNIEIDNEITKK